MRQIVITCVVALAGIFTTLCAQDYPYEVPCGEVTGLTLSETVSLNKWDVPKFKAKPTLEPNETFALVALTVTKGRSVGKYDYTLSGMSCLAIAQGEQEFDPINKEFVTGEGDLNVRLLFKVKKEEAPYSLVFSYATEGLTTALGESKTTIQLDVLDGAADGGGDGGGEDAGGESTPTKTKKPKKPKKAGTDDGSDPRAKEVW